MKTGKKVNVRTSKYEKSEMLRRNKIYWKDALEKLHRDNNEIPLNTSGINSVSGNKTKDLCEKVYKIMNYDATSQNNEKIISYSNQSSRRIKKEPSVSHRKTILIDRELDSDTDVELSNSEEEQDCTNVHLKFLKQPRREQITWKTRFLQPERDDEKSLIKRADDLTERIAQDFCEYMKALGGDQQSQLFTVKAIKELFQVEFDTHVARSLQVIPKEMPTVIDKIAEATGNLELSRHAALAREISRDIKTEKLPNRSLAFGRSLPRREQWISPKNDTKNQWRSAKHVPRDLVILKTVWEGITNLRSVREYCRWMIQHPEHRRAPYLNSLGMFDSAVLNTRLTMELQSTTTRCLTSPDNTPEPIDHLRRRLSELADIN